MHRRLPLFVFLTGQLLGPQQRHDERFSYALDSCQTARAAERIERMTRKINIARKRSALTVSPIRRFLRCMMRRMILSLMTSGLALLCHASRDMENIANLCESAEKGTVKAQYEIEWRFLDGEGEAQQETVQIMRRSICMKWICPISVIRTKASRQEADRIRNKNKE